jgi:hypothetical protein
MVLLDDSSLQYLDYCRASDVQYLPLVLANVRFGIDGAIDGGGPVE